MAKRIITSKVAGVSYRQDVIATLRGNEPCRLRPEPENKYDPHAIAVEVSVNKEVKQVGYLPRDLAKQVAPHLDGETIMCHLRGKTGGFEMSDGEIANYGLVIEVELPDTNEPNEEYVL